MLLIRKYCTFTAQTSRSFRVMFSSLGLAVEPEVLKLCVNGAKALAAVGLQGTDGGQLMLTSRAAAVTADLGATPRPSKTKPKFAALEQPRRAMQYRVHRQPFDVALAKSAFYSLRAAKVRLHHCCVLLLLLLVLLLLLLLMLVLLMLVLRLMLTRCGRPKFVRDYVEKEGATDADFAMKKGIGAIGELKPELRWNLDYAMTRKGACLCC